MYNELKEELKKISIEENYYKTLILIELGYGEDDQKLKETISQVIYHGNVSVYDLGKEYIDGYGISLDEYYEDGEDSLFYDFCDHETIAKNLTHDSSDDEFYTYIDYEAYGKEMILDGRAFFGEEFYDMEGHILEIVDYDWLSEQNDPINTPEMIVACYETVSTYLDKGNSLETAITYAGERIKKEVA